MFSPGLLTLDSPDNGPDLTSHCSRVKYIVRAKMVQKLGAGEIFVSHKQ